jgi:hypothetical protein
MWMNQKADDRDPGSEEYDPAEENGEISSNEDSESGEEVEIEPDSDAEFD